MVNEALERGGLFALKTGLRAAPIVLHLPAHFKLNRLMNSPSLQALVKHQPRLGYKYLGNYLANNLSRNARLGILYNHYDYLARQVQGSFFASLLTGVPLWQDCRAEDGVMSIQLTFPSGIDFEGDLALTFAHNGVPLYNISFVVAPGRYVRSPKAQVLFVSRIQGTRNFELIRQCTKSCHDITPAALLISALQGVAAALNINTLVGISTEERLYDTITFDYNSFWESFQAERTPENLFFLGLPLVKTPIELIKGKRRERTLRKRQYKDDVCEAVRQGFTSHLLEQQAVLN
ncbi:DUF535 family protein [Hymenobacter nivis]|uniref:DUF535 family protein n=1 Tax=Hymenobacter nivis TaxID=1850093 RepID=UPI001375DE7F|nr:DUF535 family protein [Hymenobacter nivis]